MSLSRRGFIAAATTAIVLTPIAAQAVSEKAMEAIRAYAGGEPAEGGVTISAPEIAENGNTVPVGFEVEGDPATIESVSIFADGNPSPEVATFYFGPLAGGASASVRMRMAKTQNVVVVAKMSDGTAKMAAAEVKVTIGGCGG